MIVIYPKTPTIGLVVGTYGTPNYIQLHLESRKRNYPEIPIMIHDDFSDQQTILKDLCNKYNAKFVITDHHLNWILGDLSVFTSGLLWAKKNNIDILVKMSRRFIPLHNWVPNLQKLALETQATTFSHRYMEEPYKHGTVRASLRTECIALHVNRWYEKCLGQMLGYIQNKEEFFMEFRMHHFARQALYERKIKKCGIIMVGNNKERGIAVWDIIPTDRYSQKYDILWRLSDKEVDYLRLMHLWNLIS